MVIYYVYKSIEYTDVWYRYTGSTERLGIQKYIQIILDVQILMGGTFNIQIQSTLDYRPL